MHDARKSERQVSITDGSFLHYYCSVHWGRYVRLLGVDNLNFMWYRLGLLHVQLMTKEYASDSNCP